MNKKRIRNKEETCFITVALWCVIVSGLSYKSYSNSVKCFTFFFQQKRIRYGVIFCKIGVRLFASYRCAFRLYKHNFLMVDNIDICKRRYMFDVPWFISVFMFWCGLIVCDHNILCVNLLDYFLFDLWRVLHETETWKDKKTKRTEKKPTTYNDR